MKKMKLFDVRVDFVFKKLFGEPGSESTLLNFLNAILKLPEELQLKTVTIKNSETMGDFSVDKKALLDIKAISENGTKFNIEIQMTDEKDIVKRSLFYWSLLYREGFHKGKSHRRLSKTIAINLLNFRLLDKKYNDLYHTVYHVIEKEHHFPLTDVLEIHMIELPKMLIKWKNKQVNTQDDNKLVRWLLLLEAAEDVRIIQELKEVAKMDNEIKKFIWDLLS